MALAITQDHRELASVAARFTSSAKVRELARSAIDGVDWSIDRLWDGMVDQGWPGLHIAEADGGQGFGLTELSIVLAELAARVAPESLAPSAAVAALLSVSGTDAQRARFLVPLASGSIRAGVSVSGEPAATVGGGSSRMVHGTASAIVGGGTAHVVAVVCGDDVVIVDPGTAGVTVAEVGGMDPGLAMTSAAFDAVDVDDDAVIVGGAGRLRSILRVLFAAEAVGIAFAASDAAVEYAKIRVQFGRPIGSFQAVKHHCANMAIRRELAAATTWDACRTPITDPHFDFVAATAAASAFSAAQYIAQTSIQVHGGIGFTWDHDAHLHLRRAVSLAQLFGPVSHLYDETHRLTAAGARGRYEFDLPPVAETYRTQVREFVADYRAAPPESALGVLVDSGYGVPHWPAPYGRGAGPVEQLVVDAELAGIKVPNMGIGAWILLTLVQNADADQVQRWVRPTLMGEHTWCQLFSEPGAGSDAASIATKGVRVEGGWRVTGQKVWTSGAQNCDRGFATVRTDPAAPKRDGITTMVIDMTNPAVTVRPLREITGLSMFNEVFIDDLFVPDSDVIGEPGSGWAVARATLGNERVTIGGGAYRGVTAVDLVEIMAASESADDPATARSLGELLVEEHGIAMLGVRKAAHAVADELGGTKTPGGDGNIGKILSAEHAQRVSELGVALSGAAAVIGAAPRLTFEYLFDRCLSLGGGTSEISRNVIAERLLGLPREPGLD